MFPGPVFFVVLAFVLFFAELSLLLSYFFQAVSRFFNVSAFLCFVAEKQKNREFPKKNAAFYPVKRGERRDLNPRPSEPQSDALTN
jgi:choline-glycine betaine transporter